MSKKSKNRHRVPGIPAANASPSLPPPDGFIPFENADGSVDQMAYWHGPEGRHTAAAAASLEG